MIITVLLAFAIVIAVLGISITLGLAVFERTREIGLMRAVGMTKRQTRKMVRWEAVIVSTFGAVLGIVLGTLLGVALSLAVPDSVIDGISFSVDDDRDHPRRRRARRADRRPLPQPEGVQHGRPRSDRPPSRRHCVTAFPATQAGAPAPSAGAPVAYSLEPRDARYGSL